MMSSASAKKIERCAPTPPVKAPRPPDAAGVLKAPSDDHGPGSAQLGADPPREVAVEREVDIGLVDRLPAAALGDDPLANHGAARIEDLETVVRCHRRLNFPVELFHRKVGRTVSVRSPLTGETRLGAVTFSVDPSGFAADDPAATLGDTGL